ncbi:MAG: sel1 repeat family protein [Candidatus Thiodiazotropha sp.]
MQYLTRLKNVILVLGLLAGIIALNGCSTTPDSAQMDETKAILKEAHLAYNKKAYKKVFQLIFPLAAAGNDKAQYALGYLFYHGLGVEKSEQQAMHWIQQAAAQGNLKAKKALIPNQ